MPEIRRSSRGRSVRRIKRYLRAHPRRVAAGAVLGVLVVVVAWTAWRAYALTGDLDAAGREARIMRAALLRGDADGARRALERYQDATADAEAGADGPTWALLEHLPFVGDDARGIGVVASVLADLGRDGLPPVIDTADQVTADAFAPTDHQFPLERIAALEEPAGRSEAAFERAGERLDELDADGFVAPVRTQFEVLSTLVDDARSALGSAYRATRLMPSLLGQDRPHHYLLVLQNNAELRSTGGLPGSLSLVRASGGDVEIVEQADMADLGGTVDPIVQLDAEERAVFGTLLGRAGVDATLTPEIPRAAELIRARWEQVQGGRIDGVVFVDPVAVSYLLNGLGAVPVPGYPAVNSTNVVAAVENTIYLSTPDREVHSDYQNAVAEAVFDAFADGPADPVSAIRGLARGVDEGRVRLHSFVADDQREITGTAIAGEFTDEVTDSPEVGVYVNDSTESKMSYYLAYDAQLAVRDCAAGVQTMTVTMSFTNDVSDAEVDALPASVTGVADPARDIVPGEQFLVVYVTSPVGGRLVELDDGTGDTTPAVQEFRGREVATLGIRLDPGETRQVQLVATGGLRQTGDPRLTVTPGAQPGTAGQTVRSAC